MNKLCAGFYCELPAHVLFDHDTRRRKPSGNLAVAHQKECLFFGLPSKAIVLSSGGMKKHRPMRGPHRGADRQCRWGGRATQLEPGKESGRV